ncbi:MAG: hypothetical protein JO020_32405 [Chloroflexi bacterium]|nr:hypothetical protein [Chloroflexota bacterium]MBV9898882.1 hypothetical protein [Chloroflexota bacterium]
MPKIRNRGPVADELPDLDDLLAFDLEHVHLAIIEPLPVTLPHRAHQHGTPFAFENTSRTSTRNVPRVSCIVRPKNSAIDVQPM